MTIEKLHGISSQVFITPSRVAKPLTTHHLPVRRTLVTLIAACEVNTSVIDKTVESQTSGAPNRPRSVRSKNFGYADIGN